MTDEDASDPSASLDTDAEVVEATGEAHSISREERGDPRRFLARASRLLASSLDYETTLRTVAGLALPYFDAWSIVDIVEHENDERTMRRLAIVHPEAGKEMITRRLEKSWPPETEDPIGAPVVLRTREPQVVSRVTDDMLSQAARNEENLRDLRELGIGSFLVVPLLARGRVLGAMTFISPSEGEVYKQEHLELAQELAVICALAIDNARHHRDARQARRAEKRAISERDALRYAEAIVDTVRHPLLVLDQDLRVQTANRSFYQTFHLAPETTEGRYIYDVADGQWDSPDLRELLEEILPENTQFQDLEVEQEFDEIGRRTMLLNARRIYRRRGRTDLILLAIEDVTERKRAAEERERLLEDERQAREEAERAVRAREQILGIVSHDLRNPLQVIASSLHMLRRLAPERPSKMEEERLQTIERAVDRMDRLIGDLLDLSRIEAGRFSIRRAPVDAAELLEEACRTVPTQVEEEAFEIRCDLPEGLPPIFADRDRIFQVLENVIGNAIRFTPEDGRIVLWAQHGDAEVRISVTDMGPGIPEEEQARVFEPYWYGEDTGQGGAGLGLSISRGIVEAHGGRMWVESEVGEGATFHFTVPVADSG